MTAISTAAKHMCIEGTSVNVPSNQGYSRNSKETLSQSQYHTLLPAWAHAPIIGRNLQQWSAMESSIKIPGPGVWAAPNLPWSEGTSHRWAAKVWMSWRDISLVCENRPFWILHTDIQRYSNILNIYIYSLYIYTWNYMYTVYALCVCATTSSKGFLDPHLFLRNIMNNVHVTLYDHAMIVVTYCEIVSTVTGSA